MIDRYGDTAHGHIDTDITKTENISILYDLQANKMKVLNDLGEYFGILYIMYGSISWFCFPRCGGKYNAGLFYYSKDYFYVVGLLSSWIYREKKSRKSMFIEIVRDFSGIKKGRLFI